MELMGDSISTTAEYNELLDTIKRTLAAGQLRAARAVNNALAETYWQIGREIVTRQHEQGWGAQVIERLSTDLRTANPGVRGLSARNLRYMTSLASRWSTGIAQCGVARLPWSLWRPCSTAFRTERPQSSTLSEPLPRGGRAPYCSQ